VGLPFGKSERTVERPVFEIIHTVFHYDHVR